MKFLWNALARLPEYQTLEDAVSTGALPAAATGLSGIHKAAVSGALCARQGRKALFLAADEAEAQRIADDLAALGLRPLAYPARDFNLQDVESASREYEHQRLQVLARMLKAAGSAPDKEPDAAEGWDAVVACIDAALQYTLPPEELEKRTVVLRSGQRISPEHIIKDLLACGYQRAVQIDGAGQFSLRGGILDIFTPGAPNPVRLEFWGDEIDTLSFFDLETQRRTDPVEKIILAPAMEALATNPGALAERLRSLANTLRGKHAAPAKDTLRKHAGKLEDGLALSCADKYITLLYSRVATLFDYLPGNALIFCSEPLKNKERIRSVLWQWGEDVKGYLEEGVLCRGLTEFSETWAYALQQFELRGTVLMDSFARGSYDLPLKNLVHFSVRQLSPWGGSIQLLTEDLQNMLANKWACVVLAGNERSARTTAADLQAQGLPASYLESAEVVQRGTIVVAGGALSAGLELPGAFFGLLSHGRLAAAPAKKKKRPKNSQEIYSLADLAPGDYVVHSAHGIGIFDGIHKLDMHGVVKDYIKLRYAKSDTLYVPVTQLDMVSKYIGPREDSGVKLNRLGGSEWQKAKSRVRAAVRDMAKELIKLYAERMQAKGHAFSADNEWQHDFESHFEYDETEDQLRCVEEIKSDMEREAPMDRLLCGDVGFGKTEVALRAAFKCVCDSKQCALLVPTTILAWQHFQTICKRMEGFPVRIELLSRFRTPKQQEDILRRLKRGEIDIVAGTHRLVSKDVKFRDLGLVIIDEEQRFGVAQKERLKDLCKNVDVLTLSATPIPRTLNMALSGIRDMSVIEEAPHDRHPVQTYVLEHDDGILFDAIRRELRRGGQVYYLHNDVASIERVAARIQSHIAEARIGIGHGKMNEQELSEVWRRLIDHEIDVLVCTTIIETGVDVPNANTLIIDNADRMGLSQLHQIRGRVGRSNRRAYAYLTFTRNKVLSDIAQKRLSAIREFTEFGSGFKIAMRDLEIRGAGNILGGEQHGHMEAVGYDMYLKILGEAIKREKGEEVPDYDGECLVDVQLQAHIPEKYIGDLNQRLEIYRRIADIRTQEDALDVTDELIDRFGEPPESVNGLISIALLRNQASRLGIHEVKQQNDTLLFYKQKVDPRQVALLVSTFKKRVMINAGARPYISVKLSGSPLDTLSEVLALLSGAENQPPEKQ